MCAGKKVTLAIIRMEKGVQKLPESMSARPADGDRTLNTKN
jgi:hypothetical protein